MFAVKFVVEMVYESQDFDQLDDSTFIIRLQDNCPQI